MKTEEQKNKTGKMIITLVGVTSILAGIATFCGIYFTTKDYRLVKKDYDIYLNKENLESKDLDYIYSHEDTNIFTKLTSGYRFNLDALIDDNPSFKSNDYKINFEYKVKVLEASDEADRNYPMLLIKNKEDEVIEKLPYSTEQFYSLEDIKFDDSTDYFDLTFESNEEVKWVLDVDSINLRFFALKK